MSGRKRKSSNRNKLDDNDSIPSSEDNDLKSSKIKTEYINEKSKLNKVIDFGFRHKRYMIRIILIIGVLVYIRFNSGNIDEVIVPANESFDELFQEIPCSNDYKKDRKLFRDCAPKKCGRSIIDNLVTEEEVNHLLRIAKLGLSYGGSSGGASILDLHSGALSQGEHFVNLFKLMETKNILSEKDFKIYTRVKNKIKRAIVNQFGIPDSKLFLTKPTFFSRITTNPARTLHDEYWHPHIDKETYGSFHYTSLLYLTTYGNDFNGGRFTFIDKPRNRTIEPRSGRLSFFTSGSENVHFVEKLTKGVRYAITVSFTCDPKQAISDPKL